MIQIALLSEDTLIRKGLTSLLIAQKDLSVCFDTDTVPELFNFLHNNNPDIIIVRSKDLRQQEIETFTALRTLCIDIPIFILLDTVYKQTLSKLINIGMSGCFSAMSDPDCLIEAILNPGTKEFHYGKLIGQIMQDTFLKQAKKEMPANCELTERELEVVKLACRGMSNSEIASQLFIHIRTVETHRKRMMDKTNAKNFIEVVLFALKNRMIFIDEICS